MVSVVSELALCPNEIKTLTLCYTRDSLFWRREQKLRHKATGTGTMGGGAIKLLMSEQVDSEHYGIYVGQDLKTF